jgi:hypothetical protein
MTMAEIHSHMCCSIICQRYTEETACRRCPSHCSCDEWRAPLKLCLTTSRASTPDAQFCGVEQKGSLREDRGWFKKHHLQLRIGRHHVVLSLVKSH